MHVPTEDDASWNKLESVPLTSYDRYFQEFVKLFIVAETIDLSELEDIINRFYKRIWTVLDMANNSVNLREVAYPRGVRKRVWCCVQTPLIYSIYIDYVDMSMPPVH